MAELKGYKVTVEGQYFVQVGDKGKAVKRYKFDINLPSMDSALSIIKNKVLDITLSKMYEDYVSYRTHEITNVVPLGASANVRLNIWQMNRETVESFITENELPVKAKLYPVLMDLRDAIDMAQRDVDRFLKHQEQTEKDFELNESLRALNPELYNTTETGATDAPDRIKGDVLDQL